MIYVREFNSKLAFVAVFIAPELLTMPLQSAPRVPANGSVLPASAYQFPATASSRAGSLMEVL